MSFRVAAAAIVFAACSFDHGMLPAQRDAPLGDSMLPIDAGRCAAVDVAAGGEHTCALAGTGEVYCWGRANDGQIGTIAPPDMCVSNTVDCARTPTKVKNLPATSAIGVGAATTCSSSGGHAYCWGKNTTSQFGNNSIGNSAMPLLVPQRDGATAYDGGTGHMCSLAGTTLSCSGQNGEGQVGNMSVIEQTMAIGVKTAVTAFSLGSSTTCAADTARQLYCWGRNTYKTIDETMTIRTFPTLVTTVTDVLDVAAGGDHVCVLVSGGLAKCWGLNSSGQLGNGQTSATPQPVTTVNIPNVAEIDASRNHTCLRTGTGDVYCFGDGYTATPAKILDGATKITCGGAHDCALLGDGSIRCWGDQTYGQLGNNVDMAARTLTPQLARLCP